MTSMRHSYLLSLLLSLIAVSAMGQGQVFIMGQVATISAGTRFTEAMKIKTTKPVSSINMATNTTNKLVRTTLYGNTSKIVISSISLKDHSHMVLATLTSGDLPKETALKLSIAEPSKNFKGDPGEISSTVELNHSNVAVIREISTCTSGKNPEDGYGLMYTCDMPAKRKAYTTMQGKCFTVTLTVSSESTIH